MTNTQDDGVTRLAFVVDDLGPSQASYSLITALNKWVGESNQNDGVVFLRQVGRPCTNCNFPLFSLNDLPGYRGHCIATSFDSAQVLMKTQGPKRIAYYMQNPDWLTQFRPFEEWREVFLGMPVLCRSDYHRDLFSQCWNRRPVIVGDFDIGGLLAVLP